MKTKLFRLTFFLLVCLFAFPFQNYPVSQPPQDTSGMMYHAHAENVQENIIVDNQTISITSIFRGIIGIFSILLVAFLISSGKKNIAWKNVLIGLLFQLVLAVSILHVSFVADIFNIISKVFIKTLDFSKEGSQFLFGDLIDTSSFGFIFIFQVLPIIVFFAALTSVLFYFGIIQFLVKYLARLFVKSMNISGAESLSVAGNIFLGQTESPLLVRSYIKNMTNSEIMLLMTGGMATIAGSVMAAYIGFLGGEDPELRLFYARHLLTASVMAAPGAIIISKIIVPQTQKIDKSVSIQTEKKEKNILEALSNGTTDGLRMAINVAGMLLVFVAFMALLNYVLNKTGEISGINQLISEMTGGSYTELSFQFMFGQILSPFMWLLGVCPEDMGLVGELMGEKIIMNEFIGYVSLSKLISLNSFTQQKSIIMATYMLCGFANFASIGIQIGGISVLAPSKRSVLAQYGVKALIAGTLSSFLSATIIGMIIG